MFARLLLVFTLIVAFAGVTAPTLAASAPAKPLAQRWIIRLSDPPLAQAPGIAPVSAGFGARSLAPASRGRLQLSSVRAQQYSGVLQQRQTQAFAQIQRAFPAAKLQRRYNVVFNGLAVTLPSATEAALARLRALPGVAAIYPEVQFQPTMFSSIPLIGADVLWASKPIGGQANAGAGIKIAIIDAGIKIDNPFFNPAGFSYPAGFPKGDSAHTTPKVIAARAYYRPDRPPLDGDDTPEPGPDDSGHGTHVAGTAAGIGGTEATVAGVTRTISGVAPRAYLMNYKIFYAGIEGYGGGASIEAIAALEDAVKDGADVINNSWGGTPDVAPGFDPVNAAAEAAVNAGVTVVFSNGNSGPDQSTTGSPAFSDKVISVGATTTAQTIEANFVDVVAPSDVPDTLKNRPYRPASFGPPVTGAPFGPASVVPVASVSGSSLACDPLPADTLSGRIALIERGICAFSVKVFNAQHGGASAVLVYNSAAGGEELITMASGEHADEITIPSGFVARSVGLGLTDLYASAGESAKIQLDPNGRVVDNAPDVLASFSSRGPSYQGNLKPDVVAPGVNILSSGFGEGEGVESHKGFGIISGTSMASPHVAGSAALLKQAHPNWSPADIKSALMSTANEEVWRDDAHTQRADVLEQGAGRIDLRRAATPGLLFDRPSISFGNTTLSAGQPTRATLAVSARNAASAAQTYTLSGRSTSGNFDVTVTPSKITLGANQTVRFEVTITLPADAGTGDYEGVVELAGPQPLHLPVWARALPAEQSTPVLLLDNDGSSSLDLPDYSGYYGNALDELNIPFTYVDLDARAGEAQTLPSLGELQKHQVVIWFTGDNGTPSGTGGVSLPLTPTDQNEMIAYLQAGGRLIASGQNLADASDISNIAPGDPQDRSILYQAYLGAQFVQDDVFTGTNDLALTAASAETQPWLGGVTLNLGAPSGKGVQPSDQTGAGNQSSIDEVQLLSGDPRQPDIYTTPLIRANSPARQSDGFVALNRASEPTLEQPGVALPFRSTYLSFGLEAVRSDTGTTTRAQLLQDLINWSIDQPSVSISGAAQVAAGQQLTLTANTQSNTSASFVRYRWDFGDGSPILDTDQSTVNHQYAKAGTYTVRVEATDGWGHKAVATSP